MSESESETFNDPGLKAAIRRVWGEERCPAALRQRIISATAQDAQTLQPSRKPAGISRNRFRPVLGFAMAAMVLVAIGLYLRFHQPSHTTPDTTVATAALPATLADDLVARHDECCAAPDHHMPGISRNDFGLIRQQLGKRLGIPVLSAALAGGWDFRGASVCAVGSVDSGHLVFKRGAEFVSLFSLPPNFLKGASTGPECAQTEAEHPIAGFRTASGFYCVVGSSKDGSLTLDQVRTLRDELRPDVTASTPPPSPRVTIVSSH